MILLANANAEMIPLPDGCVHAVVTSPPYYGLRKYSIEGDAEIGLEDTPEAYLARMVAVFREVRRVLRDDGACWVNMGDSYANSRPRTSYGDQGYNSIPQLIEDGRPVRDWSILGLKELDLCNIPSRLVLALQADGWYHRSTIVWAKPNPMPESVSGWRWERHKVKVENRPDKDTKYGNEYGHGISGDTYRNPNYAEYADCPGCSKCEPHGGLVLRRGAWRPTTAHEYIFMLAKTADYFADGEAVREDSINQEATFRRYELGNFAVVRGSDHITPDYRNSVAGRNARTVWEFPTQPYPGSHFATYPEELPRRCLRASISERGCCPKCGAQWARVVGEVTYSKHRPSAGNDPRSRAEDNFSKANGSSGWRGNNLLRNMPDTTGWLPTCDCPPAEPVPAVVLDPFAGSGTTGIVARELGAHFIGLDLSYSYLHEQARERLGLSALDAWSVGKARQDGKVITDLPLFGNISREPEIPKQDQVGKRTYTGFNARWDEKHG